jgi:chromosome segregation ATPase
MRGEVMSHLMALLEATKITMDNREELVVDLSTEMVEKDLQVEQLSNEIQELEELVGTRENTIEVLEDQLINTQQQLAEASTWICTTRRSRTWRPMRMSTSREDRSLPLALTLLTQGDHLPPSRALPRLPTRSQG